MLLIVEFIVGKENVYLIDVWIGVEDFFFFVWEIFGLFLFVGGMFKGMNFVDVVLYYIFDFFIDDSGLDFGVKLLCNLMVDYMIKN